MMSKKALHAPTYSISAVSLLDSIKKNILIICNITQVAAAFYLVCKRCRVSVHVHMVLLFIDHEASVHPAPPKCLFSLSV